MAIRSTKIVATLGPATEGEHQVHTLAEAGMDAARLNFSHGSHEEYARAIAHVRAVSAELGRPLAIIADLQGPKIRVGEMPEGGLRLVRGQQVELTTRREQGSPGHIPINFPDLAQVLTEGEKVLLDDGRISLKVLDVEPGGSVTCRVTVGGTLGSRKGVNFPGITIPAPSVTAKDEQDLAFALQAGADYVALSFVRTAEDVTDLRRRITALTDRRVRIIAKIEKHEAIRHINQIIEAADAVMVARGDLGVEIPAERVPYWQKEIIRRAQARARTVITATQMLETMIANPTPTRAEASDVANAVYDGTDALMLSGETAIGRYPARAVATMNRIARTVEATLDYSPLQSKVSGASVTDAISAAAAELSGSLDADAIVTPTSSGTTALEVSKNRPKAPILAVCSEPDVVNQLALAWGVQPNQVTPARDIDDMFSKAVQVARASGVRTGRRIIITAGVRVNVAGMTNLIQVHMMEPEPD